MRKSGAGSRAHSRILCPLPAARSPWGLGQTTEGKEGAREPLTREISGRVFTVPWTASPVSSRSRVFYEWRRRQCEQI